MQKFLSVFSVIVLCLFGLSVFGWMSVHVAQGDKDFGFLNGTVKFMYSFLDQFNQSVEEVQKKSPTFQKTPENLTTVNKLEQDVKVLTAFSRDDTARAVAILNLRDDSIHYQWNLPDSVEPHDRVINPVAYPNRDLVYSIDMRTGLRRVDSACNIIWQQDSFRTHHSLTVDSAGNLWACSFPKWYMASGQYWIGGRSVFYTDNYITQVDANTGRILFHKSVTEILRENGLIQYLINGPNPTDPIHLNDCQPALKTTPYYREGDVFLSIRNLSMILHYRPSSNKVLRVITGIFTSQHDVDFLNDSTLVWFNNNWYLRWTTESAGIPSDSIWLQQAGDFYSNLIRYDLKTEEMTVMGDSIFRANRIFTNTEGLQEFINDSTYFVEEQNYGEIWIIQNEEVIYQNVYQSQFDDHHHLPNWTRILTE